MRDVNQNKILKILSIILKGGKGLMDISGFILLPIFIGLFTKTVFANYANAWLVSPTLPADAISYFVEVGGWGVAALMGAGICFMYGVSLGQKKENVELLRDSQDDSLPPEMRQRMLAHRAARTAAGLLVTRSQIRSSIPTPFRDVFIAADIITDRYRFVVLPILFSSLSLKLGTYILPLLPAIGGAFTSFSAGFTALAAGALGIYNAYTMMRRENIEEQRIDQLHRGHDELQQGIHLPRLLGPQPVVAAVPSAVVDDAALRAPGADGVFAEPAPTVTPTAPTTPQFGAAHS